ncbi:transposase [Cellulomonas sp. FA1]|uniref:transposase n=1 Tax=Cellulomonas sp. FA1 TaxID=1346710 RepID=UPI00062603F6|nr:transposase [Cellulomonas sp. FA1]
MFAHSAELRQRAIDPVLEGGRSIAQIALELDMSATTIRRWVRVAQYAETGAARPARVRGPEPPYRRELTQLRRRSLEREVEQLKGAAGAGRSRLRPPSAP